MNEKFLEVGDVMQILGISRSAAYKLMRQINSELEKKEQIIMSEKRLDAKNRWRNVVVAFRMSPEEAQELNMKVSLSGLSKQDYIIQCLLKHEIRVVGGMKVAKKVQVHLDTILEELQTLDEADRGIDVEELLVPLKHVLDILQSDEKGGNHYE